MSKSDLPYIKSILESNKESNIGITVSTDINLSDYSKLFIKTKYPQLKKAVVKALNKNIRTKQLDNSIYNGRLGSMIYIAIANKIGNILYLLLFENSYKIIGTKLTDELTIDDIAFSIGNEFDKVYVNTEFRLSYRHSYTLDTIVHHIDKQLEKHNIDVTTNTVLYYQDYVLYVINNKLYDIIKDEVVDAVRDIDRRIDSIFDFIIEDVYHLCVYDEDALLNELKQ